MLHISKQTVLSSLVKRCVPVVHHRSRYTSSIKAMAGVPPSAAELRGQSCSLLGGCSSDTPKVTSDQLSDYMTALPSWKLSDDQRFITRSFVAKNFLSAVKFFNRVAEVAEQEGHHPDLHLTNYREVQVVLSTHAVGGLTMFDFITAAKLDAVEVEYSPKWLKQNQHILSGSAAASTSQQQGLSS